MNKVIDLFPLEMHSIEQVYEVSPIVINELYKYYIFELTQE
jgi:hypothetical protein